MKKLLSYLIVTSILVSCAGSQEENYIVILSMDGFRWDYPNMTETPNLDSIAKVGVKAEAILSAFPSKTFPNHYTMATGLYPDNQTIIENRYWT